jgi:hypothetical protein
VSAYDPKRTFFKQGNETMSAERLDDLYFDKGSGAIFFVSHEGRRVRCFVEQRNAFLEKKATGGMTFPDVVRRYESLIHRAALAAIERDGVSADAWGNLVSAQDCEMAQGAGRANP